MWAFYAVALPFVVGMVVLTLHHFASPHVRQFVKFIVGYTWFVNLAIVILVPVDVWTTMDQENHIEGTPGYEEYHNTLKAVGWMWSCTYWSAFFLTWSIIPLLQGVEDAGDFTLWGRVKTAIRSSLILYTIVGAIAVIGVSILIAMHKLESKAVMGLAIDSANLFALVTGVFLLGFGLVELPRGLWRFADLATRQKLLSHRVAKVAEKLDQAHQELSTTIVIAQAISTQMTVRDPLRKYMDIIDSMLVDDPTFKPSGGRMGENDMDYDTDEKSMADLRRRLRRAQDNYGRYKTEYAGIVWQALELEDTIKNCDAGRAADWRFISTLREQRNGRVARILDTAEWLWRCAMRQQAVRVFAVILGAMSCTIIFAEATIIPRKYGYDLSIFSILIKKAKGLEIVLQLLVMVPLAYICVCTYYSLFRLGMFSMYYFVPKHTDSVSLLMNCSLMSRYAAPMCKNFLSLIDCKFPTTFEQKMGQGMILMGTRINLFETIVPLFMVVYTCLIMANVHSKVVETITKWARFSFDDDDDALDGFSATGLIILRRERAGYDRGAAIGETVVPLARNFTGGDLQDLEAQSLNNKTGSTSPPYNSRLGATSPPQKARLELINGHNSKDVKVYEKGGASPSRDLTPSKNRPSRDKDARGLSPVKASPQRDKEPRGSPRHHHGAKYSAVRDFSGARPPHLGAPIRGNALSPDSDDHMGSSTATGRPMPDNRRPSDEGIFPSLRWDHMKSSLRDMATAATSFTTGRQFGPLKGADESEAGGREVKGGANALTSSTSTLDNIFEGLRSKRLQEEDDDQDDLGNLLPAGKKSETYGRR